MGRSAEEIKKDIESGNTALGIEFGSTRIKAVLTDGTTAPIAQGSYEWENRLENGIWTYSLEDIWKGLQTSYQELAKDEKEQQKKYSSSINRRRLVYLPYQYLFEPQYASAKHN